MAESSFFKAYGDCLAFSPDRYGKSTLFENEGVLVGLNCFEPGQSMEKHAHEVQTRFYFVVEGNGLAWVGRVKGDIEPGMVVWVPPGNTH